MKKLFLLSIISLSLGSCSKSPSNKDTPDNNPAKAVLILPAQNELCNQGQVISDTRSTVSLKWDPAAKADSYEVNVKNLEDNTTITKTTNNTQIDVELDRNTPYSWYVVSKSLAGGLSAKSDTWKFYNSGPATTDYAPFPADMLTPAPGQTVTAINGKVTLTWSGSDVDNDIAGYDVYFGDTSAVSVIKSGLTTTSYDVDVTKGSNYYWKIATIDSKGNKSYSRLIYFTVN